MKKSVQYKMAMIAVINSAMIPADGKVEILETLAENKKTAEWCEKKEAGQ